MYFHCKNTECKGTINFKINYFFLVFGSFLIPSVMRTASTKFWCKKEQESKQVDIFISLQLLRD